MCINQGDREEVERVLHEMEQLLTEYPYLREQGDFQILKGIWRIHRGLTEEGEALFQEGLATLKQSSWVPHMIGGVKIIIRYLTRYNKEPELLVKYTKMWESMSDHYQLEELKKKVSLLLMSNL
jgi:hypothetical protein